MTVKLSDLVDILDAEIIVGQENADLSFDFCTASDLMSDVLRGPTEGSILITGLNNAQVIRASVIAHVGAIVLVRKKRPNEDLVIGAKEHDIPVLRTPLTMFTVCGRLSRMGLRGVEDRV